MNSISFRHCISRHRQKNGGGGQKLPVERNGGLAPEEKCELSMIQSRPARPRRPAVRPAWSAGVLSEHKCRYTAWWEQMGSIWTCIRSCDLAHAWSCQESFVRLYDAIIIPLRVINLVVMIIIACKRYTYIYTITFISRVAFHCVD